MTEFDELDPQLQADLITWFNVKEPNDIDKQRLAMLIRFDSFEAWNCPECKSRIYFGQPRNWDFFQGVNQVDYVSYPVALDGRFVEAYAKRLCDHCRMTLQHHTPSGETWFNEEAE